MASLEMLSKESMKISKPKKEKSTRKRKASDLVKSEALVSVIIGNGAASESTRISSTTTQSQDTDDECSRKSEKTTKIKREKSIKKRKSSALEESVLFIPTVPEPLATSEATTSAPLITAQSPNSDHAAPKEPFNKKRKLSVEEIEVDVNAPEPPSKKALRRLKKGKPLPPPKSGADSTPEPETKREKKVEAEKRSEHGVWIGNLPWSVSKEALRTFLVEYSDITPEMITRVHMPGPNDKKSANKVEDKKFGKVQHNKGFAYVDFSTAEAVEKAIELSEQLLSGRRVLIKNHNSFEGRPQKTKEESRNDCKPPSTRIFLGNLSFDVTEEILKEHFERCGAIESVKVATFEDSGKCKGYAWIVFEELEAAKNAVRGWVHIEEEVSDVSGSEDDGESDDEGKVSKPKNTKKRKWWVNKIKGRPLRMEFAEGADVRYKKRYGKDGTKNGNAGAAEASGEEVKENRKPVRPVKAVEYRQSYAPRLTGGIVESTGKKVTF